MGQGYTERGLAGATTSQDVPSERPEEASVVPPGLSALAVSLSAFSAFVYFLSSYGVRNYVRWLAEVARSLWAHISR